MKNSKFELNYNVTGSERKHLVTVIANATECKATYLGAPSFAYEVDYFTISKEGCVSFDDRADSEEIERLITTLAEQGFEAVNNNYAPAEESKPTETPTVPCTDLIVSLPFDKVNLANLEALLAAKGKLIRKAMCITDTPIVTTENEVKFPWFDRELTVEEVAAFTNFIGGLAKMSRELKRVMATEHEVESEKYAFRGLLLRMGFIGNEYKETRKILLSRLSGYSAFPTKAAADEFAAKQKAKREAEKVQAKKQKNNQFNAQ